MGMELASNNILPLLVYPQYPVYPQMTALQSFNPLQTSWLQEPGRRELILNVRVQQLPPDVDPSDVDVNIENGRELCIFYKKQLLVQWKLASTVSENKCEFTVQASLVQIALEKADDDLWRHLIDEPIDPKDPALVSESNISSALSTDLHRLPPPSEPYDEEKLSEGDAADLRSLKEENNQIALVLARTRKELETVEGQEEAKAALHKRIDQLNTLLDLNIKMRLLRSEEPSLANWKQLLQLNIRKHRVNAGLDDDEVEEFANDEERRLTAEELDQLAIQCLQERNQQALIRGMHFLRLSALHRNSSFATVVLVKLYAQANATCRAASFLIRRADMDDCDPETNYMVAGCHDRGEMLFSPIFELALYYAQRAAASGNVNAMLQLHLMYTTGALRGQKVEQDSPVQQKRRSEALSMLWLHHAANRGSAAAYEALSKFYHSDGPQRDMQRALGYKTAFLTFTQKAAFERQLQSDSSQAREPGIADPSMEQRRSPSKQPPQPSSNTNRNSDLLKGVVIGVGICVVVLAASSFLKRTRT